MVRLSQLKAADQSLRLPPPMRPSSVRSVTVVVHSDLNLAREELRRNLAFASAVWSKRRLCCPG